MVKKKEELVEKIELSPYQIKAKEILSKIVVGIKHPNKYVVEELVTLVNRPKKTDQELKQVLQDAKILFSELIKDVDEPNIDLIDEYITLLVDSKKIIVSQVKSASSKTGEVIEQKDGELRGTSQKPLKNDTTSEVKGGDVENNSSNTNQNVSSSDDASKDQDTNNSDDVSSNATGHAMLGLMMDEIKELMSMASESNSNFKKQEEKIQVSIDSINQEQKLLREELDELKSKFSSVEKSIEKFIGLYEVVTNMYNPFVKQDVQTNNTGNATNMKVVSLNNSGNSTMKDENSENITPSDSSDNFFDKELGKKNT